MRPGRALRSCSEGADERSAVTVHPMRCVIVADDLTGAADSSAALAGQGLSVHIAPWPQNGDIATIVATAAARGDVDVLVIETASRDLTGQSAAQRLADVASALADAIYLPTRVDRPWTVKKIDSVLRGPIAAEVTTLRDGIGATMTVIAPAFPRLGRTTVDGIQWLDSGPVDTASGDTVEGRSARDPDVARACGLPEAIRCSPDDGPFPDAITVHDAQTDAHLRQLAERLAHGQPRPLIVCSAGLLEHLAPLLAEDVPAAQPEMLSTKGPLLVLSLSPTPAARAQLAHLAYARRAPRIDLNLDAAVRDPTAAGAWIGQLLRDSFSTAPDTTPVLLGLTGEDQLQPDLPADTVRDAALNTVAAGLAWLPRPSRVLANGGDAARLIVEQWHPGTLQVVGPLVHGAALARGTSGTLLALKSGGFGPTTALTDLVDVLGPTQADTKGDTTP